MFLDEIVGLNKRKLEEIERLRAERDAEELRLKQEHYRK